MTSLLRSIAQIVKSSEYLFVPRSSNSGGFTSAQLRSSIDAQPANVIRADASVVNVLNFNTFMSNFSNDGSNNAITVGQLYRDMGKVLHVLQNGIKMATFRYGQLMDDANAVAEGVGIAQNFYLCVWQADGSACPNPYAMVKVVRAG